MALQSLKSGKYIKVLRDRCIFTPNSVEVSFYSFDSKHDRDAYFSRKQDVSLFVANSTKLLDDEYNSLSDEIMRFLKINGLERLDSLDDLPEDLINKNRYLEDLGKAIYEVRMGWDSHTPPKFDGEILIDLKKAGYDESWMNPLPDFSIGSVSTGAFTNQRFTYDCLYKELKKIFKNDYIDC